TGSRRNLHQLLPAGSHGSCEPPRTSEPRDVSRSSSALPDGRPVCLEGSYNRSVPTKAVVHAELEGVDPRRSDLIVLGERTAEIAERHGRNAVAEVVVVILDEERPHRSKSPFDAGANRPTREPQLVDAAQCRPISRPEVVFVVEPRTAGL